MCYIGRVLSPCSAEYIHASVRCRNPIFTDNGIYFGVISEGARSNATNGSVVNVYLLNTKENKITYEYNIDYNDINHSEENK